MDNTALALYDTKIEQRIFTIRGVQVMLDSDLASLYQVETKIFNQAVKRNIARFPEHYRFQLTDKEWSALRSQIVTLNVETGRGQHRKYLPYAFTEQGIAMLSAVLKSQIAVEISIKIMDAFVKMRHTLLQHQGIMQRLEKVERQQLIMSDQLAGVFSALNNQPPKQGIFFNGETFDAYHFVAEIIKKAEKSILLVDNYVDDSILTLFTKCQPDVEITIFTKNISKQLTLDVEKYNSQYHPVTIKQFDLSHDRFLIIDRSELYHIGASLKDLGKKWFAFSKMELTTSNILALLDNIK